jgi:hypothetical protein
VNEYPGIRTSFVITPPLEAVNTHNFVIVVVLDPV